jgi:DNA repair and recombination protein RAD52
MSFSDTQKAELAKPLDRSAVKDRKQAGRKLSYVEGWRVIAEANRIFGFDGWQRETTMLTETNRDLVKLTGDSGPYEQWRIGYIAKVRVTVGEVVREGTGYGSGMGKPEAIGDAVEGAIKEAETDAMKRALMTFGNPFGLALYDKEQAHVADEPAPAPAPRMSYADQIQSGNTVKSVNEVWERIKFLPEAEMPQAEFDRLYVIYQKRIQALKPLPKTLGDHLDKLERESAATNPH